MYVTRRRLIMELIKLYSHEALVTAISDEVYDLAAILDIPTNINHDDDHVYIREPFKDLSLESYHIRRGSDVMVSSKVFCEILMLIKAGISVREAYNKQGYTFN